MVESILFLARADDVRAAVERSRLDLGEELRRQAEYFEGLAEERGLSLDAFLYDPVGAGSEEPAPPPPIQETHP